MDYSLLEKYRQVFRIITAILITFTSIFCPAVIKTPDRDLQFDFLDLPEDAVVTLESAGLTEQDLRIRAESHGGLYEFNRGYSDINGLVVSPYYTANIGETQIPVYATNVYTGVDGAGEIHSFSEIYIDKNSEFSFNIELHSKYLRIVNAIVLPESLGTKVQCKKGVAKATIDDFGIYTFMFNNASQRGSFTLFVREKIDDDKEIEKYKEEYGEENVIVVEKGLHYLDYYCCLQDNTVVYLKQGSYLIANHKFDITCEEDEQKYVEEGVFENTQLGFIRYPFVNFNRCKNVKLLGRGILDLSHLDRRERRGVVFTSCENVEVSGPKIINSPEWSFITYNCENVKIDNTDIFGYKTNADAYAICNSRDVTIDNCFARTGDDLFDVKTLGGSPEATSERIAFTNCIAWAGKARCFGICGEVMKKIDTVSFTDCAVICHDAAWNIDRIAPLAIIVENGGGSISNVTFENIEIFRADARAISCVIYNDDIENFNIENIVFKNISYNASIPNKIATNSKESNSLSATIDNVKASGIPIKMSPEKFVVTDDNTTIIFK